MSSDSSWWNLLPWAAVLLGSLWTAHWGAEQFARPLRKLRRQWGISVAAGGALVGLAAASPEIGINASSAWRGSADVGFGVTLGSNILAIPLMVATAYLASRTKRLPGDSEHREHLQQRLLRVERSAVTVQALPYLAIIGLFALLTVPAPWRGLQPLDALILLGAYAIYLAQALFRKKERGERVEWQGKEIAFAIGGVAAVAGGTYFAVMATERIVETLDISRIIGGLFITSPVAMMPEMVATWTLVRSGQTTSGVTSVVGDHAVVLTLGLMPLALVSLPIENMGLFVTSLVFMFAMGASYGGFIHFGASTHGFLRWQVLTLLGLGLCYVAAAIAWAQ